MLDLGIDHFDFITIVAGVLVAVVVVAVGQVLQSTQKQTAHRKRMAMAKSDRAALRSVHANAGTKADRERDERKTKALEDALGKLNLQKNLENASLRQRLVRAGIRSRRAQLTYILMQLILPPIMGVVAIIGYKFAFDSEGTSLTIYAAIAVGGALVGYMLPGSRVDGMAQDRQKGVERALPDALDLLTICVESGMSIEQSLSRVSAELGPHASVLSEEIELLNAELSYLGDRRLAFENFVNRTGASAVKTVVSALVQAERYGTPIGQALRVISAENRFNRMSAAETKAASLPAKLTVPMMVFFIPALFIVILGPAILDMMENFSS